MKEYHKIERWVPVICPADRSAPHGHVPIVGLHGEWRCQTCGDAIELPEAQTVAMPTTCPPDVLAAVVGGGVTSDQVTKIYGLLRAALALRPYHIHEGYQ